MADKVKKDPTKLYDSSDSELAPGDEVTLHGVYMDQAKTDAGADCRVRILGNDSGYSQVIAAHSSQLTKD